MKEGKEHSDQESGSSQKTGIWILASIFTKEYLGISELSS